MDNIVSLNHTMLSESFYMPYDRTLYFQDFLLISSHEVPV